MKNHIFWILGALLAVTSFNTAASATPWPASTTSRTKILGGDYLGSLNPKNYLPMPGGMHIKNGDYKIDQFDVVTYEVYVDDGPHLWDEGVEDPHWIGTCAATPTPIGKNGPWIPQLLPDGYYFVYGGSTTAHNYFGWDYWNIQGPNGHAANMAYRVAPASMRPPGINKLQGQVDEIHYNEHSTKLIDKKVIYQSEGQHVHYGWTEDDKPNYVSLPNIDDLARYAEWTAASTITKDNPAWAFFVEFLKSFQVEITDPSIDIRISDHMYRTLKKNMYIHCPTPHWEYCDYSVLYGHLHWINNFHEATNYMDQEFMRVQCRKETPTGAEWQKEQERNYNTYGLRWVLEYAHSPEPYPQHHHFNDIDEGNLPPYKPFKQVAAEAEAFLSERIPEVQAWWGQYSDHPAEEIADCP